MFRTLSLKRLKGIFPGYRLLAASSAIVAWGFGLFTYGFGIYVKPLTEVFGWSRAQISFAYSFQRLEGGIEGPFGGIATDKWGPRVVNFTGFVLFGLGFCGMYFVNSLWMFYVVWIVASIGGNLGMTGPLDAAIANWFVRRRGLMVAIVRSLASLASPGMLLLVTWVLYAFGWRHAFLILGVSLWIVGLPLTWFFVKPKRPEYYGWLPDGRRVGEEVAGGTEALIEKGVEYAKEVEEVEFTARQAMKDKIWWICALSMTLRGVAAPVINVHLIPHLTDVGFDPMVAAAAFGSYVFMTVPGRIGFGWLGDWVRITRIKWLVIIGHLSEALGLYLIIIAPSMAWLWAAVVVYGLGHGGNTIIWVPLRGRYWGRKAYATIQGAMLPFTMVAGIIAPVYAGWAYDTTGSYMVPLVVVTICVVISAVIMYFANPPKRPEKVGKITEVV